jgi:hypothetical protein
MTGSLCDNKCALGTGLGIIDVGPLDSRMNLIVWNFYALTYQCLDLEINNIYITLKK